MLSSSSIIHLFRQPLKRRKLQGPNFFGLSPEAQKSENKQKPQKYIEIGPGNYHFQPHFWPHLYEFLMEVCSTFSANKISNIILFVFIAKFLRKISSHYRIWIFGIF